jgi:outer membrane protease
MIKTTSGNTWRTTLAVPVAIAALAAEPVLAADPSTARFGAGDTVVSASVDYLDLFGDELVYYGPSDGRLLSRLLWESSALGATLTVRHGVSDRFSLQGSVTMGLLADSYMEDYDWLARDAPFFIDDWTHRSRHPDTDLDHYYALDLAARYELAGGEDRSFGVTGGILFTDVQWSAYGGDYVYSSAGFRDVIGTFPDGLLGISYRQVLPAAYAGVTGGFEHGDWSFDGMARIGLTFGAYDIDHHWLRDIKFEEDYPSSLYFGLAANATYKLRERISLTFGAQYDHYATMKGPTLMTTISGGDFINYLPGDSAGAAFNALKLSAGVKAKF